MSDMYLYDFLKSYIWIYLDNIFLHNIVEEMYSRD